MKILKKLVEEVALQQHIPKKIPEEGSLATRNLERLITFYKITGPYSWNTEFLF